MKNSEVFGDAAAVTASAPSLGEFYRDYQDLVSLGLSKMDSDPDFYEAVYKMIIPFYDFQNKLNQDLSVKNPLKEPQLKKIPMRDHIHALKATLNAMEDVLDLDSEMPAELEGKIKRYVGMLPRAANSPTPMMQMAVA